ncbi:Uncharacterised protein [Budvicia aquatica]|uniref:Uncharacterized protein n=1 Tax=Budvicia aquatica TaxID=82979 RepID=A0A484ZCW5_9GAMM|nr:Uncharacterised protein [Budvicia aquatica]
MRDEMMQDTGCYVGFIVLDSVFYLVADGMEWVR